MLKTNTAKKNVLIVLSGILLIVLTVALTLISRSFALDVPPTNKPVILFVILLGSSGVVYLLITLFSPNSSSTKVLIWILIVGAILRIIYFFSIPILEDDYFRYLWDGGVVSTGINPYQYSPEQIIKSDTISDIPQDLQKLAKESDNTIHNINHPHLSTIYPPIAQVSFAIAHWIEPWSLFSWRLVLLVFDVITLLLIYRIIKQLNLPPIWILIYWWNPLFIKEIFNSAHLDVIAFPFVVGALILYLRKKNLWSVFTLSLSIGVKIWPLFLLPLIIRPLFSNRRRLLIGLGIFILIFISFIVPFYQSGVNESSGLLAYGQSWQNNDSLFKLFAWMSELILILGDINPGNGQLMARIIALGTITIWIGYITFKKSDNSFDLFENSLLIVAFVFLVIPTQFPWYYTWMLPFLAICPRPSLLMLTVLLPLYYMRYYLEPRGMLEYFNNVIVWIEFVPVWILLIIEWRFKAKRFNPSRSKLNYDENRNYIFN